MLVSIRYRSCFLEVPNTWELHLKWQVFGASKTKFTVEGSTGRRSLSPSALQTSIPSGDFHEHSLCHTSIAVFPAPPQGCSTLSMVRRCFLACSLNVWTTCICCQHHQGRKARCKGCILIRLQSN